MSDNIVLVRIDDRLIHGQVMTGWVNYTKATNIIIVDDQVARDEFSLQMFEMVKPSGVEIAALTVEEAQEKLKDEDYLKEKTIILCKTPREPYELIKDGVSFDVLNVGGMGGKPGRQRYFRNIAISEEEMEILKEIEGKGVRVEFRILPDDNPRGLPK